MGQVSLTPNTGATVPKEYGHSDAMYNVAITVGLVMTHLISLQGQETIFLITWKFLKKDESISLP